ncbi:hypothetical protein F2Q68_00025916 [Brassica cretica]|uniref:Uncharacterized protein n=1 Tax=Brassica cretica TaxID=69181 RepID=A0A8S9II43_BRACR|nr:hypothetical protein F2Q68_00025916 [Brassica cretica]
MASSYFERPQEEEDTFEDHIDGQVLLTMADVKHCHSRHLSSPLQSMSTGETNSRPRVLYHPIQSIIPTTTGSGDVTPLGKTQTRQRQTVAGRDGRCEEILRC